MNAIINFIESFSKKLGVSPAIMFIPFSKIVAFELLALELSGNKGAQELIIITPGVATLIYFFIYFITSKVPSLHSIRMINDDESVKYFRTIAYSVGCFTVSAFVTMIILNNKYEKDDKLLYHTGESKGIAIAHLDYVQLSEKQLNETAINNIIKKGFVDPLNETFENFYSKDKIPKVVTLKSYLPLQIKLNELFITKKVDYEAWAKKHGYDIVLYGEAEQGESDNIFLKLDFKIFNSPKTLKAGDDMLKMYYTISNYDNDVLLASFDNMLNEIGGLTMYLDGKYKNSEKLFTSVIKSLNSEITDYKDSKASSERERKSFENKRFKLEKNLGIIYFYLGNTQLMAGKEKEAEIAFNKSKEFLDIGSEIAELKVDSLASIIKYLFTAYAADDTEKKKLEPVINNLSIAYAKNGKYNEAEKILVSTGAEKSNNLTLSQNLGVLYLEQGIKEAENSKKNEKIQKALKLLSSVGDQLNKDFKEKQNIQNKELKSEYNILLQNNFHNQGVLSILNKDFDKAENFFQKEVEMIKIREDEEKKEREEMQRIEKEMAQMEEEMRKEEETRRKDEEQYMQEDEKRIIMEIQRQEQERKNQEEEIRKEEVEGHFEKLDTMIEKDFINSELDANAMLKALQIMKTQEASESNSNFMKMQNEFQKIRQKEFEPIKKELEQEIIKDKQKPMEEMQRLEEEKRMNEENDLRRMEEIQRPEEDQRMNEENDLRRRDERQRPEEDQRMNEENDLRRMEERQRLEEEKRMNEENDLRRSDERQRPEEDQRMNEENDLRRSDERQRPEEDQRMNEENDQIRMEEMQRLEEEKRMNDENDQIRMEEMQRLEEEKRMNEENDQIRMEEMQRLEEEKRMNEENDQIRMEEMQRPPEDEQRIN